MLYKYFFNAFMSKCENKCYILVLTKQKYSKICFDKYKMKIKGE